MTDSVDELNERQTFDEDVQEDVNSNDDIEYLLPADLEESFLEKVMINKKLLDMLEH